MSGPAASSREIVVLYDGECGMCNRVVTFTLRHERAPVLKFSALGSPYATRELAARGYPEPPPHTVVIIDGPRVRVRSDASLFLASHLRAPWCWTRVMRLVPRPLRDILYDFVATRRQRWFPNDRRACAVPDKATRERFLS